MKVKNINTNSKKTEELIKSNFIKLLSIKKEISLITVTELVKSAGITRSSFYTHYGNTYDVAKDIQDDTIAMFLNDDVVFNNYNDVCNYIDDMIKLVKENEKMYSMIVSSLDAIIFFDKVRDTFVNKMYDLLIKSGRNDDNLKLDVEFFMDGVIFQVIKYLRDNNYYSLDLIGNRVKKWLKDLFNIK